MDLSQKSITGREFELNRRGYDPDAVDSHLNEIAAAVAARESRLAELEALVPSLQAKVQDADESEEALRLTLKAAAHAKQELLAGARDQVKTMEAEAAAKAATVVSAGETEAKELTSGAEAQAAAIKEAASAQAQEVAKAALAESEMLVGRIEGLRIRLAAAESALHTLTAESGANLVTAREALDAALKQARDTVEKPVPLALEAIGDASVAVNAEHISEPAHQDRPAPTSGEDSVVETQKPATDEDDSASGAPEMEAPQPEPAEAAVVDSEVSESMEMAQEAAPHLEVVAPAESTSDISDKVDRLLEELREVT